MNTIIWAIILGIVQGLTEFLPVSSSGHLEIVKFISGNKVDAEQSMMMTVILHFATALATIYVFRKDILEILSGLFSGKKEEVSFALKIILSMIPAAVIGVLFEDQLEALFAGNLVLVGAMLLITGLLLFLADRAKSTDKGVSYGSAVIIGISQAIAMLPGISRSGATISTSVLLGIDRAKSARFSFLMVVPLIFGKIAKDILDGGFAEQSGNWLEYGAGFIAAFFTGILACQLMIRLVKNSELKYFSFYCLLVGLLAVGYGFYFA